MTLPLRGGGSNALTHNTFAAIMRRLSRSGFKKDFVRTAVLPDWWDDACAEERDLLPEIEIRVARFLDVRLAAVRDPSAVLAPTQYANAQLRRVRDVDRDRLAPAIHAALTIGAAVVRSLREPQRGPEAVPADALQWRQQLRPPDRPVALGHVVADLWTKGIPVVPLDVLPAPRFQGIACVVEDRPVILLGHRHDEPGRVAFLIAHEAGHVAAGDCLQNQPVVDEEEVLDNTDIEVRADRFATLALVGQESPPAVEATTFRELANRAAALERSAGADAGQTIFAWAARVGDYATATMAVQALYRGIGAKRLLRQYFDQHVDLDSASESDRALLRCVYGDPERDETAR